MNQYKILRPIIENNNKLSIFDLLLFWIFIIIINQILIQPTIKNKKVESPLKYYVIPKFIFEPLSNIKSEGGDPNLSTSE
ncbi:hypothetical protein MPS01_13990 [Marinilactibacillus psychrotolerans]|uniref:Uncharacterized protein n=1 Tax=Marinilactibacillus psychrotolerans TaxID=191770 RepID=A0AAV3WTP8_9LACT|nr:hypothetical protein MPS01_13990 [Marinilactibacillus psychrotolerans]GEQ36048.1 hypothetical protein M132T_15560 [Marinilactibacillus psychrotolerans]SDC61379.1 hypothetical protein SAMN04488013_10760 [Marinilactibacillus psychrotolerans]